MDKSRKNYIRSMQSLHSTAIQTGVVSPSSGEYLDTVAYEGKEPAPLIISNQGVDLVGTTYWESDRAKQGLLYLSANAGSLRLLIPPSQEVIIPEILTGKTCALTFGPDTRFGGRLCIEIMFDDFSDSPFCVTLEKIQSDTWIGSVKKADLMLYTEEGLIKTYAQATLRSGSIPCMRAV